MTYAELEADANRLAHRLRRRYGIQPNDRVALLLARGSREAYTSLLAVLKAGAAYVPLDPEYPTERIAHILADSGSRLLLCTTDLWQRRFEEFTGRVMRLDEESERAAVAAQSSSRLLPLETGVQPDDLCYLIYTSGSTGKPKGVQIQHRQATHFVQAERQVFTIQPEDRVYQGFSLAFDASVEELWLAWANGAALVAGAGELAAHAGPTLSKALTRAGVTVLSCVPTLLAMLEEDVPTVRLLIVGGEECPQGLVTRWWRPHRRMVNTYGPTEATVVATWGDLHPERPVTIGRPLPGCRAYVLDEALRPVPTGADGELCLAGPGIALGYLGQPDLTARKFVTNPFDTGINARLYRTGDLARWTATGEIEFRGRIDSQVKVRGFRVELSEIENALLQAPGVRAAAVAAREDAAGVRQLVGYVVPDAAVPINGALLFAGLREQLPLYMVPATLVKVASLPLAISGKVDRRLLPPPEGAERIEPTDVFRAPCNEIEALLAVAWAAVFEVDRVSVDADFFYDLGGHSLTAARLVSELRRRPAFEAVSILDVYQHPTIAGLAAKIVRSAAVQEPVEFRDQDRVSLNTAPTTEEVAETTTLRHRWCAVGQFISLYFVLGLASWQFLAPYVAYSWLVAERVPIVAALIGALAALFTVYPVLLVASIAVKWLVLGRVQAGDYPIWGGYHLRFWFVRSVLGIVPTSYLTGTPLLPFYYRLLGARIGRNVYLGSDSFAVFDTLAIGDDASIGTDASLLGYTVENGRLRIGRIVVGDGAFVGNRAVVREEAALEDGARLDHLSLLERGEFIPAGQTWRGSPARPVDTEPGNFGMACSPIRAGGWRRFGSGAAQTLGLFLFQALGLAALLPGTILLNELEHRHSWWACVPAAFPAALSFILLLALEIAAVKWLLLGKMQPGHYPRHGWLHLRKWFVDQLLALSLDILGPLYATLYLNPWYRLLGAKVGKRAEISTASFVSPDLLTVGEESFVADAVSLGAAHVERDTVRIDIVQIGRRSFIGNSAVLPPGIVIGDDCLIGCLSVPPTGQNEASKDGTSWMGSPAIFLPHRQQGTAFAEGQTFKPSRKLVAQRLAVEFFRVTMPLTCSVALTSLLLAAVGALAQRVSLPALCAVFPLLEAAWGLAAAGIVIALKWTMMGRYQPGEKPLWSVFVWRTELMAAMHEYLANLFLIELLTGTPFVCTFFRLLGAKIGRRVYLGSTEITEYDLVEIGDDACINESATLQTHLFEDRVMKMGRVEVGEGASVGCLSLVLYDTRLQGGASLNALSLLMKGETLPRRGSWQGIPATRTAHNR